MASPYLDEVATLPPHLELLFKIRTSADSLTARQKAPLSELTADLPNPANHSTKWENSSVEHFLGFYKGNSEVPSANIRIHSHSLWKTSKLPQTLMCVRPKPPNMCASNYPNHFNFPK